LRIGVVKEGSQFNFVSREGTLVVNNLLLSAILGIVFVGTLYPLAAEAFGDKLSVGPPYFNATTGPLALFLVVVMALGPVSRWRRDNLVAILRRVAAPVALTAVALVAVLWAAPGIGILPLLGIVLAIGVGVASLAPLWGRSLRRTPMFTWGMVVAHLGIAVSLGGMASESAFTKETLVAARFNETHRVGPYAITLKAVEPIAGPNWTAIEGTLEARRGNGTPFVLKPQSRQFWSPPTETNEAAIATRLDGQLYVVLGKPDETGRWQLRLWWKPMVTLIWLGGAMVAFGGFLSLVGRWRRDRIQRKRGQDFEGYA
jgi:cytochrome c-type biogenesis protein CcmF